MKSHSLPWSTSVYHFFQTLLPFHAMRIILLRYLRSFPLLTYFTEHRSARFISSVPKACGTLQNSGAYGFGKSEAIITRLHLMIQVSCLHLR